MTKKQEKRGLYNLLAWPSIYEAIQIVLGAYSGRKKIVEAHITIERGMSMLDLGCGSGVVLDYLPPLQYVGIDNNMKQIANARKKRNAQGTFIFCDFSEAEKLGSACFDLILAGGLLHHLDDARCSELFFVAQKLLKPSGKLVTIDPAYTTQQHWVSRLLARLDSGRHVRTPEAYKNLSQVFFDDVTITIHNDLLRVPYTNSVLTCRTLHAEKNHAAR